MRDKEKDSVILVQLLLRQHSSYISPTSTATSYDILYYILYFLAVYDVNRESETWSVPSYMVAEPLAFRGSLSISMTMNGIEHDHGVPVWDGDPLKLADYENEALWYQAGLKPAERDMASARLWQCLKGPAKDLVKDLKPADFLTAKGVEKLLTILKNSPLGRMPVPDAFQKIQLYDHVKRKAGEVIGEYVIREDNAFKEMISALKRVRLDRQARRRGIIGDEELDAQGFFEAEIRGYRLLQNARLSREERQMVLAGTLNDTDYNSVVTQLRSSWEDHDLRDHDRGMKGGGWKGGRSVNFADADTSWYADQIFSAMTSGDSEVSVTWTFDEAQGIWWAGVLDPYLPEPTGWMHDGGQDAWWQDWAHLEESSSWAAEEMLSEPGSSSVLALIPHDNVEDEKDIQNWQAAEVLAAEANRTVAQARAAVSAARQNRSGFFPPGARPPPRTGKSSKGSGKSGKSKGRGCLICGKTDHFWRECPDRHAPKGGSSSSTKGKGKNKSFYLGNMWAFDSFGFIAVVMKAEMVLDCGATESAGGGEAVQNLIDALFENYDEAELDVDTEDWPWLRFANGEWGQALSRVWILCPMGWIGIYLLDAENVPVLAGVNLMEQHDVSFRRNELTLYQPDGSIRAVPLRRAPSGHRLLNVLE